VIDARVTVLASLAGGGTAAILFFLFLPYWSV
jgi:hypothetical protein